MSCFHTEQFLKPNHQISLHQLHITRIENLDKLCRDLRIIYLQDNAITRLENLHRLKCLDYINLAMNAIEVVEGLAGCESLRKLDLTLNFIGELSSVKSLVGNSALEELYLTGNPCTMFPGYRQFVVAALPQLKQLDGIQIENSERILAYQQREEVGEGVAREEEMHRVKRRREREEHNELRECREIEQDGDAVERRKRFFEEKSTHCPETKLEMQEVMAEIQEEKEKSQQEDRKEKKEPRKMFMR